LAGNTTSHINDKPKGLKFIQLHQNYTTLKPDHSLNIGTDCRKGGPNHKRPGR
jgi:hypothetical protein